MATAWYIAPYDLEATPGLIYRVPAMHRYIPQVPNADGSNWAEVEILANHILVKVSARPAVLAAITADPDFLRIPEPITPIARAVVRNRLVALGYNAATINATGFDVPRLLRHIASTRNVVALNAMGTGVVVLPDRRAPGGTIEVIEERVP